MIQKSRLAYSVFSSSASEHPLIFSVGFQVPASGEVFTLSINSDSTGIEFASTTEATITVQAKQSSLFQIAATDM